MCGLVDENITSLQTHNNPLLSIQRPIIRARAQQLNLVVSSFLSTHLFDFKNRLLLYDYVIISKDLEARRTHNTIEVERWRPKQGCFGIRAVTLKLLYGRTFLYIQKLIDFLSNGSSRMPKFIMSLIIKENYVQKMHGVTPSYFSLWNVCPGVLHDTRVFISSRCPSFRV
jgi:hypothetical protein